MKKNLVAQASRISDMANKLIVNELEKEGIHGIVPSHGGIFHLLYTQEQATMKEIADYLHKTKPTVTVLINKLEKMEYLYRERSDIDSRIIYIKLTRKGGELKPIFEKVSDTLNEKVYKNLNDEECESVENILQKVLHNLM